MLTATAFFTYPLSQSDFPPARWYNTTMKKITKTRASLGVLLIVVLATAASLYSIFGSLQKSEAGPPLNAKITRVVDGIVTAYLIELGKDNFALIDAGMDPQAKKIISVLKAKGKNADSVIAIFVTHAHPDHVAGIAKFKKAVVFASSAEVKLAAGTELFRSPASGVLGKRNSFPFQVTHALDDEERVQVGNTFFYAFHIPGHTPGSVAYLVDGALILGDGATVRSNGSMTAPQWFFSDDPKVGERSLRQLASKLESRKSEIEVVVTSHTGNITPEKFFTMANPH
jgi:hydroxyacylglutathione hydrolase